METGELIDLIGEVELLPRDLLERLKKHSSLSQRLLVGLLKRHRPMV